MRTTFNLEAWLYQVCYTSIGHQRGHQPHLKWYPMLLLYTWKGKVHLLLIEWWINYLYWPYLHICCKSCKTRLDVYMLKQLHHPNLSIEGGLSFTLTHLLDQVVSWINRIDQTSWLMWIMGSSASLLFPAVSTTYLVISGFKIISCMLPRELNFHFVNSLPLSNTLLSRYCLIIHDYFSIVR